MEAELIKTFRFEAAHSLPNVPPEHKCRRLHGHSYRVDVHVTGVFDCGLRADDESAIPDPQSAMGWVIDFGRIKQAVGPVLDELDHRCLNDIPGLANSTSEMLCKYLWDRIAPSLTGLSAITVWESDTSRCVYRGR